MDAPSVQYTKTSDGYSIAYMVSGEGPAIVSLPNLFQHSQRVWKGGPIAALMQHLAQRYQVVQYDSRGQGMSQRGLPAGHSMAAYELDLDAVIKATHASTAVLLAANQFGHVAVRYASRHKDAVPALILYNTSVDNTFGALSTNELATIAETNWESFLVLTARSVFPRANPGAMVDYFKAAANREDHLRLLDAARISSVAEDATRVQVPTLILAAAEDASWPGSEDFGKRLAPLIPKSRLVVRATNPQGPGVGLWTVSEVDSFLGAIDYTPGRRPPSSNGVLSMREVEVLHLIAAGRSNPQIAEELVISLNTVQRHVSNILAKTGLANRTEAAAYAAHRGLD